MRDAYDEVVGAGNRSEAIRQHMRKSIEEHQPEPGKHPLADDDELRAAYESLEELANPRTRKVTTEVAKSKLADRLNLPKESVRQNIISRLETRGLIKPAWGAIRIVEL